MKKWSDNRGVSLLELLIAVAILAIMIAPLMHLFVTSANLNRKGRQMDAATNAATNLMEMVKTTELDDMLPEDLASATTATADGSLFGLPATFMATPAETSIDADKYTITIDSLPYHGNGNSGGFYHAVVTLNPEEYSKPKVDPTPEDTTNNDWIDLVNDNEIVKFVPGSIRSGTELIPQNTDLLVLKLLRKEAISNFDKSPITGDATYEFSNERLAREITITVKESGITAYYKYWLDYDLKATEVAGTGVNVTRHGLQEYSISNGVYDTLPTDMEYLDIYYFYYPLTTELLQELGDKGVNYDSENEQVPITGVIVPPIFTRPDGTNAPGDLIKIENNPDNSGNFHNNIDYDDGSNDGENLKFDFFLAAQRELLKKGDPSVNIPPYKTDSDYRVEYYEGVDSSNRFSLNKLYSNLGGKYQQIDPTKSVFGNLVGFEQNAGAGLGLLRTEKAKRLYIVDIELTDSNGKRVALESTKLVALK
ncbi:type II secretion system GspH family protein [Lachnospiraceae bacterium ZAX-1]